MKNVIRLLAAVFGFAVSFAAVAVSAVTLTKAFSPATINPGGVSTLTITLGNNTGAVATLISALTDTLPTVPSQVVIAPTPNASTTCGGGVVTAIAGGTTVSLALGATIPAAGTCTVTVDVTAAVVGVYTNTLLALPASALVTTAGSNLVPAVGILTVVALTSVPTLSEWAMIMLAGLLALFGFVAVRRQAR